MSDPRYISVKVCGNPEANGGFMPLILFNSPAIDIVDAFYTGFDTNSYFFSVKVEKMQVIYKLMKNNVRSNGSIRAGSLVIAFSIPRGYKLEQGYDPYDVMMALKNKFLSTYMTIRDKINDTYEFNAGAIDPAPIEETARQFTLTPGTTPFFPMTEGAPVGYITCTEDNIEMLLKDIQCRNFSRFSEIVIAETVSGTTSYTPITGLQIPRVPEYTLIVDGEKKGVVTDTSQTITARPQVTATQFYDIHELTFTIDQLLNRDRIENVTLDEETETIHVSTANLAVKKSKRLKLHFVNNEQANYFFTHKNACRLTHQGRNIPLNDNFEFLLMGEELAILSNPAGFKFECGNTDKYLISGTEYRPGDDKITVKAVAAPKPTDLMPVNKNVGTSKPSEVTDILFRFNNLDMFDDNDELKVRVGRSSKTKPQQVRTSVKLSKYDSKGKNSNEWTGHVYIPSEWNKHELYTRLSTPDGKIVFETQSPLHIKNNMAEVGIKDLYQVKTNKLGLFLKSNRLLTAILAALLCCLLGGLIGYFLHDPISKAFHKDGKTTETTIKEKTNPDDPDKGNVNNESKNEKNKDQSQDPANAITDDEARANLSGFKETLSQKGLTFNEVDEVFNKYQEHEDQYENLDEKTSELIETYHEVVEYIRQGDAESLRDYCNKDNQINYRHHLLVFEALAGVVDGEGKSKNYSGANKKKAEEYFKMHYNSYTKFSDLAIPVGILAAETTPASQTKAPTNNSSGKKNNNAGASSGNSNKSSGER